VYNENYVKTVIMNMMGYMVLGGFVEQNVLEGLVQKQNV
jgi:hypothetical protein